MPLRQGGGMAMQDLPGLRGNLLPGHKAAVGFTRTNMVGGHQDVGEQIFNSSSDAGAAAAADDGGGGGGGSTERHICCLWFLKRQPPGSMGGALLC